MRCINRVPLDWAALCLFGWLGLFGTSVLAFSQTATASPDDPAKEAERKREDLLRQLKAKEAEHAVQRLRRDEELRHIQLRQLQLIRGFNHDGGLTTVEQLVFGRVGGLEMAREQLEIMQQREVQDIAQTCQLTEAQTARVALLCRGDIKRFIDLIDMLTARQLAGETRTKLEPETSALAIRFNSGFFRESSLLHRGLPTILASAQMERLEAERSRRKRAAHQIAVNQVLDLVSRQVNLSDEAREEFTAFLLAETTPSTVSCGYDHYFILLQLDQMQEGRLKTKLKGPLLAAVRQLTERARQLRPAMEIAGYFADQASDKDN